MSKRHFQCGAVITSPALSTDLEGGRFDLKKSEMAEGWWVLTDKENLVVIRFKEREFNDTQKVSILDESSLQSSALSDAEAAKRLAKIVREMAEWLAYIAYEIAV